MITKSQIEKLIKSKAEFLHSIERNVVKSNNFSDLAEDIYKEIIKNDDNVDPCPECGSHLISKLSGGVKCSNKKCDYWFCY